MPKPAVQRTEFAVDLGGANSIGGLRALWRGLLKSNNTVLADLRPIIVLREGNTGLGMQLGSPQVRCMTRPRPPRSARR